MESQFLKNTKVIKLHQSGFVLFSEFIMLYYIIIGLHARKPVFGVSDKVRFKRVCSAKEKS